MSKAEFKDAFERIKAAGIAYGDQFDSVGNMKALETRQPLGGWVRLCTSSIRTSI